MARKPFIVIRGTSASEPEWMSALDSGGPSGRSGMTGE